jgi:hypothetical protein
LFGPKLKIARAHEHLKALEREIQAFARSKPCAVVSDFDPKTGEKFWRVQGDPAPPPVTLSPIIGDALYNFRSALDHLVWQLIKANGKRPSERSAFPICKTAESFERHARLKIKGLAPGAQTAIERHQPYHGRNPWREERLLWLDSLCNIDKHRHLNLTTAATEGGLWSRGLPIDAPSPYFIHEGAVENDTELARVPGEHMDVEFYPAIGVAFGQGSPAAGVSVREVLASIEVIVESIVDSFSPFFPG